MSLSIGVSLTAFPVAQPKRRRSALTGRTALVGVLAGLTFALPQAAQATTDCGGPVDNVLECGPADGNYKDGILYISDTPELRDLTVVLDPGTIITADSHVGVFVSNLDGPLALTAAGAIISTTGDNAVGIFAHSNLGSVHVDAGDITTTGDHSAGIIGVAGSPIDVYLPLGDARGSVNITAGTITTSGNDSFGVFANGSGGHKNAVGVSVTSVVTQGVHSLGIYAGSSTGAVNVEAGNVATSGDESTGIETMVDSIGGRSTVNADIVTTSGSDSIGIYSHGYGTSTIAANSVATRGDNSIGIAASSYVGSISVTAGTVETSGYGAAGIIAQNIYGNIGIAANSVTTSGDGAIGIGTSNNNGDTSIKANSITTSGAYSAGIVAESAYSGATVAAGSVDTQGYGATGVSIKTGQGAQVTVDRLHTSGDFSRGIDIATGLFGTGAPTLHGDIDVKAGSIETEGFAAIGVAAFAQDLGNVSLDIGQVTTSGEYATGIQSGAFHADQTIKIGQIHTTGLGAAGSFISHYGGHFSMDVGTVMTEGDNAYGVIVGTIIADAALDVENGIKTSGDDSSGIGLNVQTGSFDVTNHGAILTSGTNSAGILALVDRGHLTVSGGDIQTSGDRSAGIVVTVNEDSLALGEPSRIDVAAGTIITKGTESNGIDIYDGDSKSGDGGIGTLSAEEPSFGQDVTVKADTIDVGGTGSIGVKVVANGTTKLDLGNTLSHAAAIAVDARGAVDLSISGTTQGVGDAVTLGGSDVSVALGGKASITSTGNGLVVNANGPSVPYDGGDSGGGDGDGGIGIGIGISAVSQGQVEIDNAGTIAGGTGYAVLVQEGTASITNSGKIVGAVKLADGDDTITNSSTFVATKDSDFGAGSDVFVNTGVFAVQPVAAASAKAAVVMPGTVTLLGLEQFQNDGGLVDLRNGVAGDTLSLPGSYVGSNGAKLGLDVGANGVTDKLVVAGAATGTTSILINATASTATLLAQPVTLVQTGAGSSANAFTIADQNIGFVAYGLGFDAATGRFTLTSRAGASVHRFAKANEGAQAIWQQSADAWSSHMAELRDLAEPAGRIWGQAYGKVDTRDGHEGGANIGYRQDYYGAQAGVDLAGRRSDAGNGFVFGVTGGYLSSHQNFRGGPGRVRFDTVSLGGYAAFRAGPLFANLLGQYDHYRAEASDSAEHWSDRFNGSGYGAEAEVGARLGHDAFFAEPVASLAWQRTDLGTLHALGQSLDFDGDSAITGKIGARIGGTVAMAGGAKAVFYGRAAYVHAFKGKGGVLFESGGTSADIAGSRIGDYGQGAIGVNILSAGRVSGFIEGNADVGSSYKGGGGRVGLRFKL